MSIQNEICEVMSEAYKRGWITTRDGNISVYSPESNSILITPSGVKKNNINPREIEEILLIDQETRILNTNANPSGEMEMHWLLQKETVKHAISQLSVVHLHPTYTIAAMLRGFNLQNLHESFPELSRYTRVGPSVPVIPPVSEELAIKTFECFSNGKNKVVFDIVGQKGHGVCAIGFSPSKAFEHIERLEHICKIVLSSGITPFNVQ